MTMKLEWRPIHGYEGRYDISNDGVVRSLARPKAKARLLVQVESSGYMRVSLQNGKDRRQFLVHRLVLESFLSACPSGHEAAHMDGNRKNNTIANLRWVTKKENHSHKALHGTAQRGERAPSVKLTRNEVAQIRALRSSETQRALAQRFGINRSTVQRIQYGITWSESP